jgi:magnesium chelatase subunit D
LVGTMNREEGDLRPQLLDRFGLMVEVVGPREPGLRAEVVRRRLAFESDPIAFAASWEEEQGALRRRISEARQRLPRVLLDESLLALISRLCCEFEVDGLRADIVMHKTARALAALGGRTEATIADIKAAAELVLPHRQRRRPFEQPHLDRDRLDECLSRLQPSPDQEGRAPSGAGESSDQSAVTSCETNRGEHVFDPAIPRPVRRIEVAPPAGISCSLPRGRRNPTPTRERGHYVRAVPDKNASDLAVDATIRAAVLRGGQIDGRPVIERADLHRKERSGRTGTLILFAVDASGSMAARRRMELVKGAVLGLLQSAYEQRDEVGVIAFRGPQADLLLPPTSSVELAERALRVLPTGGRTPLAHALVMASEVFRRVRSARPEMPALLVFLSDGKANVPLPDTAGDPWQQALLAASEVVSAGLPTLVLDTDAGFVRLGRATELARALGAECLPLDGLSAEMLVLKVRQHLE